MCNDLKVIYDPQLAYPVAKVVQRKITESGRCLNISKCRILVHLNSAHLIVWPPDWEPRAYSATLPIVTSGMKLLAGSSDLY